MAGEWHDYVGLDRTITIRWPRKIEAAIVRRIYILTILIVWLLAGDHGRRKQVVSLIRGKHQYALTLGVSDG